MNCRKARKAIPLLAGGDLGGRKAGKVMAHIASCPSCRKELEAYRAAIEQARTSAASQKVPEWSEAEWRRLMAHAISEKPPRRPRLFGVRPQWALVSGAAAVFLLIAAAAIFRASLFKVNARTQGAAPVLVASKLPPAKAYPAQTMPSPKTGIGSVAYAAQEFFVAKAGPYSVKPSPGSPPGAAKPAGSSPGQATSLSQDVVSVTLVSKETGLQVVWFFDKNFAWIGDKK